MGKDTEQYYRPIIFDEIEQPKVHQERLMTKLEEVSWYEQMKADKDALNECLHKTLEENKILNKRLTEMQADDTARVEVSRANPFMGLNRMRDTAHNLAKSKGWHETKVPIADFCANIAGEVSELWEAYRKGILNTACEKSIDLTNLEEETADVLIRVMDMAGALGIDLEHAVETKHRINATRSYRHGNKKA